MAINDNSAYGLTGAQVKEIASKIDSKQGTLTAGTNVQISADNEISATDTTYSAFTGTDGQTAGSAGLVPAPATTDAGKFLNADGDWEKVDTRSIKVLTNNDFNANKNDWSDTDPANFNCIALWRLETGVYATVRETNSSAYVDTYFGTNGAYSPGSSNHGDLFFVYNGDDNASRPNEILVYHEGKLREYTLTYLTPQTVDPTASIDYESVSAMEIFGGARTDTGKVRIAGGSVGTYGVSIGAGADTGDYSVAIGRYAEATAAYAVALGSYASATTQGQFDISTGRQTSNGYNSSNYRLLTGLYDPQSDHDAATKGYVDGKVLTNAGTPTTSTVGTVGQLLEDTTNGKLYQCTEIDDSTTPIVYTWREMATLEQVSWRQRKPIVVWEVDGTVVTTGLVGVNEDISANPNWQLTNLDLTPYKRIKIFTKAAQKAGATASASTTPAMVLEMSLDPRAAIAEYGGNYVGSMIAQKPNDANRLCTLTCAVSADKTKFEVLRMTNLYGTAATSNSDVNGYVFKIEGYYD